jgi:outer membrane protein insertion porin family
VRSDASPLIALDEGTAITSSVGFTYTYDRRDDPLSPSSGYLLSLSQDVAGLGGDAQYSRTVARANGFLSFFDEEVILSSEIEGGYLYALDGDIRITDRFFLGGDSFRGFARSGLGPRDLDTDDALGGNVYAVWRNQVSFPIGLPDEFGIAGGLFSDVGTLFQLDRNSVGSTVVDDDPKLRASVGVSLFWDSGFGPLRVNLAMPVLEERGDEDELFRLTAGTRF